MLKQPETQVLPLCVCIYAGKYTHIYEISIISKVRPILFQLYLLKALKCSTGNMNFSATALTNTYSFFCSLGDAWTSHTHSFVSILYHIIHHRYKKLLIQLKKKASGALLEAADLLAQAFCLFTELGHLSWLICLGNYIWKLKENVGKEYLGSVGDEWTKYLVCCLLPEKQSLWIHPEFTVYT